ncbi:MAG TPA: aldose epimerase family protein [Gemmatimonadales bacterium]|nr:aldose epimerase family protein [Gemmatimonadales bacterium]
MRVTRAPFGTTPAGVPVEILTLTNAGGLELRAMTYGGIIVSLVVPDRHGHPANVVLGHDSLDAYLRDSRYLGAIVGRYANRIAHARFTLDGETYRLAANNGPHHLHGGLKGFDKVVWQATPVQEDDRAGVLLSYTSPDGEEGYPGTLDAQVTYTLTDQGELIVDYRATSDKATPVNLTQHSYFNLAGAGDIYGHLLQIHADTMTPVDETLIPTGAIVPVADSRFDFRSPIAVGSRGIDYDQNFVVNRSGAGPVHAVRVVEPVSGRTLDVHTTEPGLQLYTGARQALCLETQHFPDSPNQPGFPSTILRPGSEYRSRTVFAFGVSD